MKINYTKLKYLFFSLFFALLLIIVTPGVLAFRTGVSQLDYGLELLSKLFYIDLLNSSQVVQIGFMKFMIFIVTFSVVNMALGKISFFEKKTAGIVSFAFSMIGTFMMPIQWLEATGGTITAVVSSIFFIAFFWGLGYVAVVVLRSKEDDGGMGWIKNLMGLLLLFLLLFIINLWVNWQGLGGLQIGASPVVLLMSKKLMTKIFKRER